MLAQLGFTLAVSKITGNELHGNGPRSMRNLLLLVFLLLLLLLD